MYSILYGIAQELNRLQNTEYADTHPERWDHFDEIIKMAYNEGNITGKQFNDLVLTAFYDYFDDFKDEEI